MAIVPDEGSIELPSAIVPDAGSIRPPATDVAGRDAGPAARRAAAGKAPGPRELTDEEAGVMSGPQSTTVQRVGPAAILPGKSFAQAREEMSPVERPAADESLQNAALMAGLIPAGVGGRVAGALAGEVTGAVAPRIAPIVASGVEAGTANKIMGGDFTTGAALGAALPAAVAGIDAAAGAVSRGAPARVAARTQRNLTEPVKQSLADKVTKVAGPEGANLQEVIDRNPDLRHALAVQAADKPAAALKAVQATKGAANAARNQAFEQMQAHYANLPASAQASIPQMLDDYKALSKTQIGDRQRQAILAEARKELMKFGDDLREAQGLPPAVNGDYSGTIVTPKDLRDFEQTIGRRINDTIKGKVNAEVYKPIARQVNALAENTPGVDAKKFAETGRDIHVLIPVEESLVERVKKIEQGKKTFVEKARSVASVLGGAAGYASGGTTGAVVGAVAPKVASAVLNAGGRVARGIDYQLAEAQLRRVKAAAAASRAAQAAPRVTVPAPAPALPVAAGLAASRREQSIADIYAPAM